MQNQDWQGGQPFQPEGGPPQQPPAMPTAPPQEQSPAQGQAPQQPHAGGNGNMEHVPELHVSVGGLTFQYTFSEEDVRVLFARYGDVKHVDIARDGASATVTFEAFNNAMAAWADLNMKQLQGIEGAFLKVECPSLAGEGMTSSTYYDGQKAYDDQTGRTQKYTCRLLIGIPNEGQYRVASKVIQIGRKIWSDLPGFQQNQGKTRLRGRGVGGIHESDEPLALCISCKDGTSFEQAVQFAEEQIRKLHADYIKFCRERGMPPPNLGRVRAICDHAHTTAPWRGGNPADRSFQEQLMHTQMTTPKGGKGMMGKGMMGGKGGGASPKGGGGKGGMAGGYATQHPEDRGTRPAYAPTEAEIEQLIEERNEARKLGHFKKADEIREILKSRAVVLMDDKGARGNKTGKQVTRWRYWNP